MFGLPKRRNAPYIPKKLTDKQAKDRVLYTQFKSLLFAAEEINSFMLSSGRSRKETAVLTGWPLSFVHRLMALHELADQQTTAVARKRIMRLYGADKVGRLFKALQKAMRGGAV